ncbi:MAG: outer membrane protein insertion porin family [Bradymonadia bacterium]|jgi:outer membrane protein insertion porin family
MMRWLQTLSAAALCLALLLVPAGASAQLNSAVSEIRVDGTIRVEGQAVLNQLRTRVGSQVSPRTLGQDVRAVYDLGFFDDVAVDAVETEDGLVLTFIVDEKPSIGSVEFVGSDKLGEDDFEEAIALRIGSILDENAVRRSVQSLEALYREKGYFLVEIDYELIDGDPGEIIVRFLIAEFAKIRVASMTILGNDALEDEEVQRYLQTRPGTFLSFLTGTGKFDLENLQNDLQTIRVLYYDNGYLDIDVDDPVIELSRDRNSIFVTVPITEGIQYAVSSVSVSGDLLESQEDTMARVSVEPGETFRSSAVREDIEALQTYYQNLGYAYVNVNLLTSSPNTEEATIGLTYDVQRGDLTYIGRIRFVGNASTRDRVIRREMAIEEGDLYSRTEIELSKNYIRRLGFFETVTVRERPSTLGANLIDLEVEIVERHTRSLQIGAGFSSVENFLATAQISENNLMGRGQSMTLNAMFSSVRQLFVLSFIEPHLWGSAVSLQLDLFNRSLAFRNFDRLSRGASASFGYRPFRHNRFWRDLTIFAGYRVEDIQLRNVTTTRSSRFFQSGITSSLTQGISLDRRNDRFAPTRGYYLALNNDWADASWGSEFEFDRVRGIVRGYRSMDFLNCSEQGESVAGGARVVQGACRWFRSWVFRTNFEIGYIGATRADEVVPVSERFYPGGPNSVRGFEQFSLGPRVPTAASGVNPVSDVRDVADGGTRELLLNIEIEFPLVDAVGIRGVVFADAGNAFGVTDPYSMNLDFLGGQDNDLVLRTALGFGFRWQSPLGMLRFEWGFPLQVREGERSTVFNFSIGPSF